MFKHRYKPELSERFSLRSIICAGVILFIIVMVLAGHLKVNSIESDAKDAMSTMKQQCISFNKLTAADRTKSLFRLSDIMHDLSADLERDPAIVNDQFLEQYVDSLRLSGVAVLNGNLTLEASGYTRRFQDSHWVSSIYGKRFADIFNYPAKVYLKRETLDGEYYDICAVARKDAPGILIGFYRQPSGLITNTENDLKSMLTNLQLSQDGLYAIAENGAVRVTNNETLAGTDVSENSILQAISLIPNDGKLHLFRADGKHRLGYRSGCESYNLYIYYPSVSIAYACLLAAAIFVAIYSFLLMLLIIMRNKVLFEKQEELRKSNRSLTQTVEMLKALETIYFSLFYVDLENNSYESVYVAPWLQSTVPPSGAYSELKKLFIETMVVPRFREDISYRMSPEYICENLNYDSVSDVRKSFYADYQAIRGDQIRWCRVTATVVDYNEAGDPYHVLALIQDIDKEKAQEASYQAQILKEAEDAKVANHAKTEFLRRISHDIRTPINGILGYINLSARHPSDPVIQKHCRDSAIIAVRTLQDLVNSVLDMSKMEQSEITLEEKPFDLTELLNNINTILAPQADAKNVRYEILRKGDVPFTHLIGSPRHLSQVVMNMTSNAVKYTEPGGYVRVNTELISKTDDNVTYEFICADNGIGMSDEFQQHMFEPFMQEAVNARTTYEGVGLGLSIMKKLVDAMGGTVTCESKKNVGTVFRVRMTFLIDKDYKAPAEPPKTAAENPLVGKNVLLAEDNELNMEIAEFMLSEHGANVTRSWNGKEAVEQFAASEVGFYDLIFMDIMMPEMNGLEATHAIRAMDRPDAKTVPIAAMSANTFHDDVQNSLDAGMNIHIAKPIDGKKLMSAVSSLLSVNKGQT